MALASTGFMAAPGLTGNTDQLDRLDVSDVLSAILLKDTATLGQIPMKGTVENTETFWFEDALNLAILSGCVYSATETIGGAGDILWNFTSSIGANTSARVAAAFKAGGIWRTEGLPTLFRVVADPSGTGNSVTMSVYSSTTITTSAYPTTTIYVSGAGSNSMHMRFFFVAQPKPDTSVYSDDISIARTKRKNCTQVFERGIQIAETREHIKLYGGVPDELKLQIKNRTYEIKRELNNSVINGAFYCTGGTGFTSDLETRTFSGIIQQLRDPDIDGTNEDYQVINASGGALTMTRINNLCRQMYDAGGFDDESNCCIIVGAYQSQVIALLEENRIRKSSKELVVGSYANKVKTDLGFELDIVLDRFMPGGTLIVLDKSRAELKPLSGDAWHLEKMAKTGRVTGYQLSGQYTVILRNTDACHGMIDNLAFG